MESVGALRFLKDKTILVTGATGFLAKIFVEKVLRIQPNVKKLYLLVRAEDTQSAIKRVQNEIVEKDLFRVVRETCGANLESFISEKVVSVAGDVSRLNLGVKDSEVTEKMLTDIDLVVNFAATTNCDERYDVALNTNTMGALHVLNFAKKCVNITMLLHVSTAYVCGERSGIIPENPFYSGETLRRTCELVINAEKNLIEKQLNQLQAENATEKEAISTMQDLGIKRARLYGWPNTYVFTKAMGEMILGNFRDDLPLVITRPTMVTSTYSEPFPGWIEGVRTIDGPILGYAEGKLKFLYGNPDTILDLIPADMVVNQMIIAMMANDKHSSQIIYQVGSSMRNPINISNLREFSLQYFTTQPLINKYGKPVTVRKFKILKTTASFRINMAIRYVLPLKVLKLVNSILCQKYKEICTDSDRKIKIVMRLVKLYKPFLFFGGIFDDTNSEKLRMAIKESGKEVDAFNFDPKDIDWEDYIINIHIPGLVRYVLKRSWSSTYKMLNLALLI